MILLRGWSRNTELRSGKVRYNSPFLGYLAKVVILECGEGWSMEMRGSDIQVYLQDFKHTEAPLSATAASRIRSYPAVLSEC
jgi:hypothetical protein